MEITVDGITYAVVVVDDLDGPLMLAAPGVIFIQDSGDHDSNLRHALTAAEALR